MKLFRFALNIWITLASIGSFLLGWAVLAHAPKPVQPRTQTVTNPVVLPTLTPLQNLQAGGDDNHFNFTAPAPAFNSAPQPLFRTSGS